MSSLTTFYIVRHGQTDWNLKKIIQGQTDTPLNKTGEKQAKELASKFKNVHFDLAFSSDLIRAKKTTEILALEHQLAVETTKLLRERSFGTFEGELSRILHTHTKLLKTLTINDRQKYKMNESFETDEKYIARILTFLRETAIAHPGKTILVGTHGGTLRQLLLHLGTLTYEQSDQITFVNTAYIIVQTDGVDFFVKDIIGMEKREISAKEEV